MREIKFRARVRTTHNAGKTYESHTYRWVYYEPMHGIEKLPDGDYLIHGQVDMQYTGLKDKNGVEICEGDIIISRDVNDVVNDSMGHLCSVIFHDGAFCISTGMKQSLCYGYAVRFEVIGNIHENPQLLD